MRIVRNHHNCLFEILIEPLENFQNFRGGVAIQIPGRLIGQQ
jgi:hypothetical protein